jgi:hypothetical protein
MKKFDHPKYLTIYNNRLSCFVCFGLVWCHTTCLNLLAIAYGYINMMRREFRELFGENRVLRLVAGAGFEPATSGL